MDFLLLRAWEGHDASQGGGRQAPLRLGAVPFLWAMGNSFTEPQKILPACYGTWNILNFLGHQTKSNVNKEKV